MIRILHLDDVSEELTIIENLLRKSGMKYKLASVANKEDYIHALEDFKPNVVLSDHSMPSLTSIEAFRLLKDRNINIPFILLTATVSEEFAVSMMREGVADYILKDRPQRLPGAIENVIEKWEAERRNKEFINQIIRSEAMLKAIMENNFDAILLRAEDRQLVYASPSTFRMLGYTWDEMKELTSEKLYHPEDHAIVARLYDQADQNPGLPVAWTVRSRHKEGHYIWTEGVVTNLLGHENVRGIVSNFREVTERKEAEFQQAQMTRELIQRNQDLEQFAYIVSHNLRAPVANILGLANILKYRELDDAERLEAQQRIFTATENLDDVIRDLNRILELKQEVNDKKETVDFQELVESISLSIQNVIEKNNVKIVTDFTQVHAISTIRSYLQSIFYNLISNSIKYKRPDADPVIQIKSSGATNGVRLVFADNGIGIDLATSGSKVFGLYKRFHPSHAEGKGMGLFMVKTQVENLGGEISIKSEVNKGTEFTIEL